MFLCLREDLKGKSSRLKDFCLPVSSLYFLLFLNGPGRTVMCSLYIYTSRYRKENFTVRCIMFSLRTDISLRAWRFCRAGRTSNEAARKIKTACPDSWPFQLPPPSTHFDILLTTCLVSVFPANQK